ncbi:MAG: hypothetical protein NC093_00095, partial [Alistipes sp.]|nr:hypothetical protein [Alistipes sp.]
MKKLLSAVTSLVMSASFVTSAFASSITVSAAGGQTAVQPNVSMGDVMGGTVNKNDDADDAWRLDPQNDDFKIVGEVVRYDEEFERHEDYKPGDTVTVEFVLKDSLGKEATTLAAIPKTDDAFNAAGLKLVMEDAIDYTSPDLATWTLTGETYYCYRFDPNTKDPKPFNDGEAIISFNVELPADLAPGDYVVDLERFSVFEQTQPKVAFRTNPQPAAVIHIDGEIEPTQAETQAPTEAETEAPTKAPAADGTAVWVIPEVEGTPGETVTMDIYVEGDSNLEVAGASYGVVPGAMATATGAGATNAAYGNAKVFANIETNEYGWAQAAGQGSKGSDGAVIMSVTFMVSEDATE